MIEAQWALLAVGISLILSLGLIAWQRSRPLESRGMIGLAATGIHLMLSLILAAAIWITVQPDRPAVFAFSVLIGYWLSLIALVVAIIRWIRSSPKG